MNSILFLSFDCSIFISDYQTSLNVIFCQRRLNLENVKGTSTCLQNYEFSEQTIFWILKPGSLWNISSFSTTSWTNRKWKLLSAALYVETNTSLGSLYGLYTMTRCRWPRWGDISWEPRGMRGGSFCSRTLVFFLLLLLLPLLNALLILFSLRWRAEEESRRAQAEAAERSYRILVRKKRADDLTWNNSGKIKSVREGSQN